MTFMFLHYMYVYVAHKTSPIKWCCHVAGDLHAGVPGLDICTDLHGVWGERTTTRTCTSYTHVFSGGQQRRRDAASMMAHFQCVVHPMTSLTLQTLTMPQYMKKRYGGNKLGNYQLYVMRYPLVYTTRVAPVLRIRFSNSSFAIFF